MKNLKNIDRLFQEKFKNFETAPSEQIWLNIQNALKEEKKEKRIIPIWFKYAGIAAVFFFGFFALNTIYKTTSEPKNTIDLEQEIVTIKPYSIDSIVTKPTKDIKKSFQKTASQISLTNDDQPKTTQTKTESIATKMESKTNINTTKNKNSTTVYQKEHHKPLIETRLVNGETTSETPLLKKNPLKNDVVAESIFSKNNNETVLIQKEGSKIAQTNAEKKQSTSLVTPNELEEILKEKDSKKEYAVVSNLKNRWEIIPNVAPMYLNTNSIGSAIDPKLSKNNKTTDNGFSIGIGVNYALTNKIALRSGINAFSVGYNTNNVSYAIGLNTNSMANVNYTSNEPIEIQKQATYNVQTSFEQDLQKTSIGSINQKMGYYEVPLEISYAVLDKKFGVKIIGGISTLFLKQNEISLISPQSTLKLGEANNLSSLHFSTNFGFGLKYEFVKSLHLNFEPIIKYQLNSYSTNSNNQNAIFIGLYSGISYRF